MAFFSPDYRPRNMSKGRQVALAIALLGLNEADLCATICQPCEERVATQNRVALYWSRR
jgi:hypothetical protein